MGAKSIVEIGVEVTPMQLKGLLTWLASRRIPSYMEPPHDPVWTSLADLEAACEGK